MSQKVLHSKVLSCFLLLLAKFKESSTKTTSKTFSRKNCSEKVEGAECSLIFIIPRSIEQRWVLRIPKDIERGNGKHKDRNLPFFLNVVVQGSADTALILVTFTGKGFALITVVLDCQLSWGSTGQQFSKYASHAKKKAVNSP